MAYVNARQILPPNLVKAIQQHVDGQLIYIPRISEKRCQWGGKNGSKARLVCRNQAIRQAYREGMPLAQLAAGQHLSEDSIRKIICMKDKDGMGGS